MLHHKSTFFIITWLTFCCFSPTASRAIIDDSSIGEFSNRTFTKTVNLQQSHQSYPVPLYLAQDSDSKSKESETKKKKSNSSDSKVPKPVRSILNALGGRKTLFLLSIISVLVTGTAVFILLKLFDDHQPKDLDPEELSSPEKVPEATSPDLETNYPNLNHPQWPASPENSSMANTENSLDSFVPPQRMDLRENPYIPISENSSKLHHQEIETETFPIIDSNSSIDRQEDNNYEQKEIPLNLSKSTEENYIVQDSKITTQANNYPLPQVNIVEQLINELHNFEPEKRHQAIWELGQKGDSRAVQPLVNLLIDSDSKQQSLILATLSEIGTKTLKPMSRALAISLQNDNAEVRKNAIRDLTRIYELIIQITNLLQQAEYDPDPEVEKTAKWALEQLNRIHTR
ncbi:HEAT repeat domain-containing protein [Dapis sp. BLCC M126]|uniref:HEAT repeat domain-containing protein n=1 Tax=Dapis sp. BLCC M126 TaxID=3400189 RepID=UPI003CEDF24B